MGEAIQKKKEEDEANALPEKQAAYLKFKEEEKKKKMLARAAKKRTRGEKRRSKKSNAMQEWRLLAAEEGLAKKMRAGKITAVQFKKGLTKAIDKEHGKARDDLSGESESDEPTDVVVSRKDHKWINQRRGACKSR